MSVLSIQQNDQMAKLCPLYLGKKLVQLVQRSNNFSKKQMLFIDKRNKIAPNIYIIDIGGYFNNVFEGVFAKNGPLKIYSLLDLPIFLEDLFCSKIIRQKFVFLFFCAKIKPSTRTCVRILSK